MEKLKTLVITSCTGEKKYHPDNQLTQDDFIDIEKLNCREKDLEQYKTPAGEIYTGMQHLRLMEGINVLREKYGADIIDLYIVSAGYGLISEHREVIPYEVTFNPLKKMQSLMAIAGKITRILFGMLKNGTEYDPAIVMKDLNKAAAA